MSRIQMALLGHEVVYTEMVEQQERRSLLLDDS